MGIAVEKPYLNGFLDDVGDTIRVPFVLLALSGGDAPLTIDTQERIAQLRGLRACFANNLHEPLHRHIFHPMPIGIGGQALTQRVARSSMPWEQRDRRLLVASMRNTNRLRGRYVEVLSGADYTHLVRFVNERMSLEEFLNVLSMH